MVFDWFDNETRKELDALAQLNDPSSKYIVS